MTDEKTDEPLTERAYVTLTRELIKVLDGEWFAFVSCAPRGWSCF